MEDINLNTTARTLQFSNDSLIVLFNNVGTDLAMELIDLPRNEQFILPSNTYYAIIGDSYGEDRLMPLWTFCNYTSTAEDWNTITRTLHFNYIIKKNYLITNLNVGSIS